VTSPVAFGPTGEDEQAQLANLFSSNGDQPSNIKVVHQESLPTSIDVSRDAATGGGFKPHSKD